MKIKYCQIVYFIRIEDLFCPNYCLVCALAPLCFINRLSDLKKPLKEPSCFPWIIQMRVSGLVRFPFLCFFFHASFLIPDFFIPLCAVCKRHRGHLNDGSWTAQRPTTYPNPAIFHCSLCSWEKQHAGHDRGWISEALIRSPESQGLKLTLCHSPLFAEVSSGPVPEAEAFSRPTIIDI